MPMPPTHDSSPVPSSVPGASTLDASPTKEFFISMLVRDVPLPRAIVDLVDNSVDGAARLRDSHDYSGLHVKITLNRDRFEIADNCGGIDEAARAYAFRFGRPANISLDDHSIGQFGVGMKRTVFKLGNRFSIKSQSPDSRFEVDVRVPEWTTDPSWQIPFTEHLEAAPAGVSGTTIAVTDLHGAVAEQFALRNFESSLLQDLANAHYISIRRGLTIELNGTAVPRRELTLRQSSELRPARLDFDVTEPGPRPVRVSLVVGVDDRNLEEGGWYVFCNDRLVLAADQSAVTGWGEERGRTIPKYHADFAFFRGYASFDSSDSGLLPWTTTKTGVDTDSPVFRFARLEMIRLMRQVVNFLRRLETERSSTRDDESALKPLDSALLATTAISFGDSDASADFISPPESPARREPPEFRRIQYDRRFRDIERVKAALGVATLREVGERTFDYFLGMECE